MALNRIPIGTFSLITRLSQKALRLYDDRGLLVPESKDRITGCVAVTDPAIEVKTIPGGSHLTLVYQGAYPGLHEAWSRIFVYQEEKGYRIAGPGRELYLNDPAQVPEEDLLTELHLPIIP
ncbi:GyrI-like domain-containing protein [Methanosphaerula palustris]|uniref:Transcription activator effector binding n=1 Tax=Methanosphaerula palustris (strain ATCC BAA-1556 / DSM 19958 / E1-9c) TaxID=521011 RepID=B8GJM5_METPE|nr:GyrI-like domain-containing protein [Methanosphaerula palustris]ACL15679.1 transcription activator effector binding [Methanosphaerula palustris E1-9c]